MAELQCFSLEDEDFNELFITQTPKNDGVMEVDKENSEDELFLGVKPTDFGSPSVSVLMPCGIENAKYSDISDNNFDTKEMQNKKDVRPVGLSLSQLAEMQRKLPAPVRTIGRGISRLMGFNAKRNFRVKPSVMAAKVVSRKRIYNKISDVKLNELKRKQIKKRSLAKMQWGVKAYQDWCEYKFSDQNKYDCTIFETNLEDIRSLKKENLAYSLCKFVPEVTKVKDGSVYPGSTLYQLVIAIQRHLNENGLNWKLIDGFEFSEVKIVLDNIMKQRAQEKIGMVKCQAEVITYDFENRLWEKNILGEDTPDKLHSTVLFLIGINCGFRAGDEHHDLRRDSPSKKSQFSFKRNEAGKRCVIYTEDTVTKTNDGGLSSLKKDRKIVWIFPSDNVSRCPVRLIDKYMSLCPEVVNDKIKSNFYLRSLERTNPAQWYSNRVLGLNALRKTITELLKSAELDGYFTNHSLRRSGTSRLFQAGISRKLVKEYMGHRSDAVDQYQITSERQRESMSEILAAPVKETVTNSSNQKDIVSANASRYTNKDCTMLENANNSIQIEVNDGIGTEKCIGCKCVKGNVKRNDTKHVSDLIDQILSSQKENENYSKN